MKNLNALIRWTAPMLLAACAMSPGPEQGSQVRSGALNNAGVEYLQDQDYTNAEYCFRKALKLDPGLAMAHLNLGILYQRIGRLERAREQYRLAMKTDSGGDTLASIPAANPDAAPEIEMHTVREIARHKLDELPNAAA